MPCLPAGRHFLEQLATDKSIWQQCDLVPLPQQDIEQWQQLNNTLQPQPLIREHHLLSGFEHQMFLWQPHHPAIHFNDQVVDYQTLDQQISQWSQVLLQAGLASPQPVAILLPKGVDQIIAVLAVLRAGGCYVPLDIHWPEHRIQQVLEQLDSPYLLTHSSLGLS